MIHVLATIELRDGTREQFLEEFRKVVPPVRAEAGCLEYGAAIDAVTSLPVGVPNRPNVVMVVEKWASLDALQAHLVAPHMLEYRPRVKEFVERVSLQILEPVTG
jgi:quinol monooxygenase YgiN